MDEGFQSVLDQVWWAVETIGHVVSDPLLAGGMVAGAGALAWGGWLAARRFWWRPVPSLLAGISVGAAYLCYMLMRAGEKSAHGSAQRWF